MATQNQIEANRRNAAKSTGPRSVEGKAVSRFNALKTGITAKSQFIPGEDAAELDALAVEYHEQFQPATALERFLVDTLVYADWQLRRLRRVEAQVWENHIAATEGSSRGLNEEQPLGQVFDRAAYAFVLLQRRIDSAERSYYRALKQLQRLETAAHAALGGVALPASPHAAQPELASFSRIPFEPEVPDQPISHACLFSPSSPDFGRNPDAPHAAPPSR